MKKIILVLVTLLILIGTYSYIRILNHETSKEFETKVNKKEFNEKEKKVINAINNSLEDDLDNYNIKNFEITDLMSFGYYESKKDIHYLRVDFNMECYDSLDCFKLLRYNIDSETNSFYFYVKINMNTYSDVEIIDGVSAHINSDWVNTDPIIE